MSLIPALFSLLAAMLFSVGASRSVQDAGLQMSQQVERLLALQRAELGLARVAEFLASSDADGEVGEWGAQMETVPSASNPELQDLPLTLQRVTVTGEERGTRVRLQADYAVDGCESTYDDHCVSRVRRIAWRQLRLD